MSNDRDAQTRSDTAKNQDEVKDLRTKPIDAKDAQHVKGGRLHDDEAPK